MRGYSIISLLWLFLGSAGEGKMINHILVPLDGSSLAERVIPHLFALARPFNSRVTLLRVMCRPHTMGTESRIDPLDWQMREAEARSYLNRLTVYLNQSGLDVANVLIHGEPATCIVDFVHNQDVDLILLSSHGHSGLTGWNISSVVQKTVIRVCKPIMIVRAYKSTQSNLSEAHYKKIFIPMDGSQRAECVVPLAVSLADFHKAELILAHAIRKPELPRRTPLSPEERELAEKITERNLNEVSRYFERLQSRFPVKMESRIAVSEDFADELHEMVSQENPDLVLVNAHSYCSSVQHPYGSLALNFIAYGTTPLLIVQDVPDLYALFASPAEMASREFPGH